MSCEFIYLFHWVNTDNYHIICSYKFHTVIFIINIDKNINMVHYVCVHLYVKESIFELIKRW